MSVLDAIGNTPMIELTALNGKRPDVRILGKLEGNSPGGSVKDRTALFPIRSGEESGELTPDEVILEPPSARGLARVVPAAVQDNAVAQYLYESVGFVRTGEFVDDGDGLPYYRMAKVL